MRWSGGKNPSAPSRVDLRASGEIDFRSVAGYTAEMLPSTRESVPSAVLMVAAVLVSLLVVVLLIVAGLWLWNESHVYPGNGTPYPSP